MSLATESSGTPRPRHSEPAQRSSASWLVPLAGAALLTPFSNGSHVVPAAAWLAPLFVIRFLRTQPPVRGLLVVYGLFLALFPFQWAKMVPLEGAVLAIFAVGFQLAFLAPYALDRLLGPRIEGFASTLVFPAAWTSLEYLVTILSPYTSWGSVAYTQYGNLPLLQWASVTGLWGITFLMCWFAAVGNWAWSHAGQPARAAPGVLGYASVLAAVLLLGGARLALFSPSGETACVASLTVEPGEALRIWRTRHKDTRPGLLNAVRHDTGALHDALLARTTQAARAGAKLVFWSELNGLVLVEDEPALIERGRELARGEAIYLGMSLGTITPGAYLMQNKLVLIDPQGEVLASYHKARPVPGDPETGASPAMPTVDTALGKIGLGICYDLDFPGLVRATGQAGADLLIVPARDSAPMDPCHTHMALVRAIENGASMVRQTDQGLSAAVDYQGRVLAAMDYFATVDRLMMVHVPRRGTITVYSRVGDLFAWGAMAGLIVLIVRALRRSTRTATSAA